MREPSAGNWRTKREQRVPSLGGTGRGTINATSGRIDGALFDKSSKRGKYKPPSGATRELEPRLGITPRPTRNERRRAARARWEASQA